MQPTGRKALPKGGLHPPCREPNGSFGTVPTNRRILTLPELCGRIRASVKSRNARVPRLRSLLYWILLGSPRAPGWPIAQGCSWARRFPRRGSDGRRP